MKNLKNNFDCQELSYQEALDINGGESLWYWLGYQAGRGYRYMMWDA